MKQEISTNMSKFKVGDRIKTTSNPMASAIYRNREATIIRDEGTGYAPLRLRFDNGDECNWVYENDLVIIKKARNIMSKITDKFTLTFKKEPEKTFLKAGIIDNTDLLTTDGQSIFLSWLLKKHGEEFKKDVVDDLLKDEEHDSK